MDDAAVEQRRRQVRGLRRIPFQPGHGLVKYLQRATGPSGPHQDESPLQAQDAPVIRRDQILGLVQEAQRVVGVTLLALPLGEDAQHAGGQAMMHLGHLPHIGLLPVVGPAQLAQPRTDMAGANRRPAAVALAQAAFTRPAG